MSHFRILVCCVALLSSICGCAKQPVSDSRAEDERLIRDMEIEASEAVAARDLGHLVSLYADDASLFYADHPMVAGKDAIRETWKAILARPGFAMSAALLWRQFATHYWNLSFLTALNAAVDAARFGHPIEHTAEVLLANLLIFSTLSAAAAGAIAGGVRHLWIRHRHPAM